jgi:hypothetical protein
LGSFGVLVAALYIASDAGAAPAPAPAPAPAQPRAAVPVTATEKLTLTSESQFTFAVQHNPKEIQVDKSVPWQKAKTSHADQPQVEFSSAQGRAMTFELMFDTVESGEDVHAKYVAKLLSLAMVMDSSANAPEEKKRPPLVKVKWGATALQFQGVIESIGTKYTMFLPNGTPVRATCVVKLKEASRASVSK